LAAAVGGDLSARRDGRRSPGAAAGRPAAAARDRGVLSIKEALQMARPFYLSQRN
jgi:hypothetical protein